MNWLLGSAVVGLGVMLSACDRSPVAYGAPNSIIVVAPEALWESVRDTVSLALEPRILTVREERTFDLTHISPADPNWQSLRMWRQVLLVGEATDPWMEAAVSPAEEVPEVLPALIEKGAIWARGQQVTAVVLPPGGGAAALRQLLPELHTFLDGRFRAYVRQRMYVSGTAEALRQRLLSEAGFSLRVPQVYRHGSEGSVHVFRNDQQRRAELVRSVVVTWRAGVPEAEPSAEWVLAWRDSLSQHYHEPAQRTDREPLEVRVLAGSGGFEVKGIWTSLPGDWPRAGPFVDRVVVCPAQNRTYLLDAWLYAPGQSKYEYMLQLETVLDSFECGA